MGTLKTFLNMLMAAVLALSLLALMAGCAVQTPSSAIVSSVAAPSDSSSESAAPADAVRVWVESGAGQTPNFGTEGEILALHVSSTVTNFAYAMLGNTGLATDGSVSYYEDEIVYATPIWQPDAPIYIQYLPVGNILAEHGFSFDGADGVRVYYYIQYSGKDGSVFLVEYTPVQ